MKAMLRNLMVLGFVGFLALIVEGSDSPQTPDETYWRQQLKQAKEVDKNDPRVVESLRALAEISADKGRNEEAVSLWKRVLKCQERALGKTHLDVAATWDKIAGLYMRAHILSPEGLYQTVDYSDPQFNGIERRAVPARYGPQYRSAAKALTNALKIRKKHSGDDALVLVAYYRALAAIEARLGRSSQSLRASREATRILDRAKSETAAK